MSSPQSTPLSFAATTRRQVSFSGSPAPSCSSPFEKPAQHRCFCHQQPPNSPTNVNLPPLSLPSAMHEPEPTIEPLSPAAMHTTAMIGFSSLRNQAHNTHAHHILLPSERNITTHHRYCLWTGSRCCCLLLICLSLFLLVVLSFNVKASHPRFCLSSDQQGSGGRMVNGGVLGGGRIRFHGGTRGGEAAF